MSKLNKLLYFVLASFIYGVYAALPFLVKDAKVHYISGAILSILASFCWVSISRSVPPTELAINGAIFDVILTTMFLFIPMFYTNFTLTLQQMLGIMSIVLGMVLIKI